MLSKAIEILEKVLGPQSLTIDDIWWRLGSAQFGQGKFPEAEDSFQHVVEQVQKRQGPASELAAALHWLGRAQFESGKLDAAADTLCKSSEMYTETSGVHHQAVAFASLWRCHVAVRRGNQVEAADFLGDAIHAIDAPDAPPKDIAEMWYWLGRSQFDLARYQQAEECFGKARKKLGNEPHDTIVEYLVWVGRSRFELASYKEAQSSFEEVLRLRQGVGVIEDVATTHLWLGRCQHKKADFGGAAASFRRAIDTYEKISCDEPRKLADAYHWLGQAQLDAGKSEAAIESFGVVLEKYRALTNPSQSDVGDAWHWLGRAHFKVGQNAEVGAKEQHLDRSREAFREALRCVESIHGPSHQKVASALQWLGQCQQEARCFHDAEQHFQRVLDIERQIDGGDRPELADALRWLGRCQCEAGELASVERAISSFQQALELRKKNRGSRHHEIAADLLWLCRCHLRLDKCDSAVAAARDALEASEGLSGEGDRVRAEALRWLGQAQLRSQQYDEAIQSFLESKTRFTEVFGELHPEVTDVWDWLGDSQFQAKRYEEAAASWRQMLHNLETRKAPRVAVARAHQKLGDCQRAAGWHPAAADSFGAAIRAWDECPNRPQLDVARCFFWRGRCLLDGGKPADARRDFQHAVGIFEAFRNQEKVDQAAADAWFWLARSTLETGNSVEAAEGFTKVIEIRRKCRSPAPEDVADAWFWLGRSQFESGQPGAAVKSFSQAVKILQRVDGQHPKLAEVWDWCGQSQSADGKHDLAEQSFLKSIESKHAQT